MSEERKCEGGSSPVDTDKTPFTKESENAPEEKEEQRDKEIKRAEENEVRENCNFLLVTGLSNEISATDLKAFFKKFGRIGHIKILTSRKDPGDSGRFAHVAVPTLEGLNKLVETTSGKVLKSCELNVKKAPDNGPYSRKYVIRSPTVPPLTPNKTDALEMKNDLSSSEAKTILINDQVSGKKSENEKLGKTPPKPASTPETVTITTTDNECDPISKESQKDDGAKSVSDSSNICRKKVIRSVGNYRRRRRGSSSNKSSDEIKTSSSDSDGGRFSQRRRTRKMSNSPGRKPNCDRRNRDSYQDRKRTRWNSPVRGNGNRTVVHQVPRRYVPSNGPRDDLSSSSSKEWRQQGSESPRLLTFEEIKMAQADRRQQTVLALKYNDAKYQGRERRRANDDSGVNGKDDRINEELEYLKKEKERLRQERKAIEREKLELLRHERERHRVELEEIEKEKAEVRLVKLRLEQSEQGSRYFPRTSNSADGGREKPFGKTIAEQMIERERKSQLQTRKRDEDDYDDPQVTSDSSLRRSYQPSSKREGSNVRRLYGEEIRVDLRASIEEKRKGYLRRASAGGEEGTGADTAEISKTISASYQSKATPYQPTIQGSGYQSKQDSSTSSAVGKIGIWDKNTSPVGVGKSDQWIRGGNTGSSRVGAYQTASVNSSSRLQSQLYAYPGYPGIGILVSRTPGAGATASLSTLYAGTTDSVDMSGIYNTYASYHRY